jgi:Uma2 family endonuclease
MEKMADAVDQPNKRFTYGDYRRWPDDESWELIEGTAYSMSPAPMRRHQGIQLLIAEKFSAFLRGKTCKAYPAPFDVLFPKGSEDDDEVDTVVQPDLVVEILSPSTQKKDLNEKFRLYERFGVREYWVVDPGNRSLQVWHLTGEGRYDEGELRDPPREYGPISSRVLEGFAVDPRELFADLD